MSDPSPQTETALQTRSDEVGDELRRLDRLADLLDEQFELPIVGYRVGLDPLIGLFPGGGDWVTWAANAYIIWRASRLDVPTHILLLMAGRVGADLVIGYVPGIGDVADAAYKCNRQNVDTLLDHFDAENPRREPRGETTPTPNPAKQTAVAVGLILSLALLAALPVLVVVWLLQ